MELVESIKEIGIRERNLGISLLKCLECIGGINYYAADDLVVLGMF